MPLLLRKPGATKKMHEIRRLNPADRMVSGQSGKKLSSCLSRPSNLTDGNPSSDGGRNLPPRVLGDAMDVLSELVGESPALEAVKDNIRRLLARQPGARRLPSILIHGEPGTGKGL